jgi:hypothetical protein
MIIIGKDAASISVGDRLSPLEADSSLDPIRNDPLVGSLVEVSNIAGGDLIPLKGESGEISGVIRRMGQVAGYEIKVDGSPHIATLKDVYVDREFLEDIQLGSPTSQAVQEALSRWSQPRTYWHDQTEGLEALCFALASATTQALPICTDWGWRFLVPEPIPGRMTLVDCRAALHDEYWTLTVAVYPVDHEELQVPRIPDHWARTFSWAHKIAKGMVEAGFPWEKPARSLERRARASALVLQPLLNSTLKKCFEFRSELEGKNLPIPPVTGAFSSVRIKAGTVGLNEPPTDRRPYSVVSIEPKVAKDRHYLDQVVLHECLHIAVASNGGDPHGKTFQALAEKLGLDAKYRD